MTCYEINCKNCGYRLHFSHGVLMRFNETNKELLEKIKQGEFGEDFKRIANENPNAQAYHSSELFRCPECGELEGGRIIELREGWDNTLIEIPHNCKKCNTKMEVLDGCFGYHHHELVCPSCKQKFDRYSGPICSMHID